MIRPARRVLVKLAMAIHTAHLTTLSLVLATSACVGGAGLSLGGSGAGTGPAPIGPPGPAGNASVATGGGPVSAGDGAIHAGTAVPQLSDFAFEVKESTGEYYSAWIVDKLITFEVAPACYEKMVDRNKYNAVHSASFYTRAVAKYATLLTGDDWDALESSTANDTATKLRMIEPMIDRFRSVFHLTISVEGDDCNATGGALWLKYWGAVRDILNDYPPASGTLFIKLAVRGDAKDISVDVDEATSTYTITAPLHVEKSGWEDRLLKPFRKRARAK